MTLKPKMNYSLVDTEYDGESYHGLYAAPEDCSDLVIHIHGTWGNFYENAFINPLGETYTSLGYNYLTVNVPGHDVSAVTESFADFTGALDAWIDAIADPSDEIILQGHSLGALKALYYLHENPGNYVDRISSLVLLSPFDVVAFYAGADEDEIAEIRTQLDELIEREGPTAEVPDEIFSDWAISAGTLKELTEPNGPCDTFPSRKSLAESAIDQVTVPTSVIIGGSDFAAYPDPKTVINRVDSIGVDHYLVDDAPHAFDGEIDGLQIAIRDWFDSQDQL